jgi:hypothetical protein
VTQPLDAAAFFQSQRPAIVAAAARGRGPAVVDHIRSLEDVRLRLVLYTMARRVLVMGDANERDLDAAVSVADAGVAQVGTLLAAEAEGQTRADLLRSLHILNFNLAADLADCWPDELDKPALRPERRHFERGLQAAQVLVSDIFEGALEPRIVANDYWVLGMHQLSLGDVAAASNSWDVAMARARAAATAVLKSPDPGSAAPFQVNLIAGYSAIASWLAGDTENGRLAYQQAIGAFQAQLHDSPTNEDARFGIAQLDTVRRKYAADLR